MSAPILIYVYLLDEGTDVWRPVEAIHLGNDVYKMTSVNPAADDEHWQFNTGDVVRCRLKTLRDSKSHRCLAAIEKIDAAV